MRIELLYNPLLLLERLGQAATNRKRLRKLRRTPASTLQVGHVDSLELLELLRDRPPRIIYDVGAYEGTWTVLAKAIFPEAEVHAFEPLAALRKDFSRQTNGLTKIYYHPIALGAMTGTLPMKLASSLDSSSILKMTQEQIKQFRVQPAGVELVHAESLDEYIRKVSLPLPNLLKLDIQGYELEALRGAEECLASVDAVLSEVSFVEFYDEQCLFGDVVAFLGKRGFRVRAFGAKTTLGKRILQTDVLFEKGDH